MMLPEYKLIIAGGRDFTDKALMMAAIQRLEAGDLMKYEISVVSGMAQGADRLGYNLAQSVGATVYTYPAKWTQFGKGAGYIRNIEMSNIADGLLAFHRNNSSGTRHMIDIMKQKNKPTWVIPY